MKIWNKENSLAFLSALRYWFAFNVERAADSYFGVVNCVSGPLGLYKRVHLQKISHNWITQSFLGEKCTYGDDRALSNRTLEQGLSIFYTPYSICKTDTPAELFRWIAQQTRWCKSFYREFIYNIRSFYKHSLWMSVELVFQFVYPVFILITLIFFVTFSIESLLIVFIFMVMMGTLRGLIGLARTGNLQFLHYSVYVFYYILFIIPCKLWAILTIWNNDWGTSSRLIRNKNIMKALHALVWAVVITIYYAIFFVKFLAFDKNSVNHFTLPVSSFWAAWVLILVFHWNTWGTCKFVPKINKILE